MCLYLYNHKGLRLIKKILKLIVSLFNGGFLSLEKPSSKSFDDQIKEKIKEIKPMFDRSKITIILSPGHGGLDPTTGKYHCLAGGKKFQHLDQKGIIEEQFHGDGWVYEGVLNRQYASSIAMELTSLGYKVINIAPGFKDISLGERITKSLSIEGPALHLPIHFNASLNHNARGMEIFTYFGQDKSDELAEIIWGKMMTIKKLFPEFRFRSDVINDGDHDKEANFAELRRIKDKHLSVYLEILFFDHFKDAQMAFNDKFRNLWAKKTTEAIDVYFRPNL